MATTFQAPPGTRDFYPDQMALRRYVEDTWRRVSLRHGFLEVDGPTFEFLDLYKVKSGDEIVSQLFHFESREDKSGNTEAFALRPEFTPTLARMVAAKAHALPRPIKWFSLPRCYRAERQQKGRLKEFFQWNVDMLGGDTPEARAQFDAEVAILCLDCLREFGLSPDEVKLRWNDRHNVETWFDLADIPEAKWPAAYSLLDRIRKISPDDRKRIYTEQGFEGGAQRLFEQIADNSNPLAPEFWKYDQLDDAKKQKFQTVVVKAMTFHTYLRFAGLERYGQAEPDPSIVRGLAYYTGFVWEISDTRGEHRAIAGGGRYDKLIEMFGGPTLPATGFGMGDVVLANLLQERGLLPKDLGRGTAPDVFIVNALPRPEPALKLIGELRAAKLVVATSYKTTKNIGKLLQDAAASSARHALILAPAEWYKPGGPLVKLKNLATREERELPLPEAMTALKARA
jgi:histidyl-tRNA synthetase